MSALKAYQVKDFIEKNRGKSGVYLLYGSDQGLIGEFGACLAARQDGQTVQMEMSELEAEPERLAVCALTPSLFGATPAIRVRNATKSIVPALEQLIGENICSPIIIEAGNLTPKDKLRQLIEKSKAGWALPCYADDVRSLEKLIRDEFTSAGIVIEADAVSQLVSVLGNDREVTRRELEKLVNFADQSKHLSLKDIQKLSGDNSALTLDQTTDAAASGDLGALEISLNRAFSSGVDAQVLLIMISRHFMLLRSLRARTEAGASVANAMSTTYPRPHFSRKGSIERQLGIWNTKSLASANRRIQTATLQSRQQPLLSETITRRALLAICLAAASRQPHARRA